MILKKPYAFLIRRFRLIHLFLTLILIYIAFNVSKIYSYFSTYINSKTISADYYAGTSIFVYLAILIVIGIFSIILVLLNRKKKPSKFYLFGIIYYIIVIIILLFANSQLYNIEIGKIDSIMLNITRDLLIVGYFTQYIFIIFGLVRASGFNIKKFDFQSDLKDLNISSEDNEEFEFDVEFDTNDVKTKFKRNIRIIGYIIKENKLLCIVLLSGLSIWLVGKIVLNVFVYNKVYRENKNFKLNDINVKVMNSYYTRKNFNSEEILDEKYIYNIVEVKIKNNTDKDRKLDIEKIKLKTDDVTSYTTDVKSYNNFIDIGIGYSNQIIKPKDTNTYIFVFRINSKENNNKKTFEMLINISYDDGEYKYNYAKVKIKPVNLDKTKKVNTVKLGETLTFNDEFLYNTKIKISEFAFSDVSTFNYIKTLNNKEYNLKKAIQPSTIDGYGRMLMQLKTDIKFDKNIKNEKIKNGFIGNFVNIRYVIKKKEYNPKIKVTDYTLNGIKDYRYIDVYERIPESEHIYLDFVVRNNIYTYILK